MTNTKNMTKYDKYDRVAALFIPDREPFSDAMTHGDAMQY